MQAIVFATLFPQQSVQWEGILLQLPNNLSRSEQLINHSSALTTFNIFVKAVTNLMQLGILF